MYEQRRTLNVYASEHDHISCQSAAQWDIMSNLIETLEPLEEVTLEMSHSESSVITRVSVLKLMLQQQGPSSHKSLYHHFMMTSPNTKSLVVATILDPHYKGKAFASAETLETAKYWLKEEAARDISKTVEESGEAEDPAKRQRVQTDPRPTLVDSLQYMQNFLEQLTTQLKSSPASKLTRSVT